MIIIIFFRTIKKMKLFGIFALIGSAFSQEEQQAPVEARLLISKKTDTKILAENVDMKFTYKIYNIGQSAALDVSILSFDKDLILHSRFNLLKITLPTSGQSSVEIQR
jgi:putative transposon-encoded protein